MMKKYIVKSNIKHDVRSYRPGEIIELTDEQAAAMPWAVQLILEEKAKQE